MVVRDLSDEFPARGSQAGCSLVEHCRPSRFADASLRCGKSNRGLAGLAVPANVVGLAISARCARRTIGSGEAVAFRSPSAASAQGSRTSRRTQSTAFPMIKHRSNITCLSALVCARRRRFCTKERLRPIGDARLRSCARVAESRRDALRATAEAAFGARPARAEALIISRAHARGAMSVPAPRSIASSTVLLGGLGADISSDSLILRHVGRVVVILKGSPSVAHALQGRRG